MDKRTDRSTRQDPNEQNEEIAGQMIGYARVRSKDKNIERQVEQLEKEGVLETYKDYVSGSTRDRPELEKPSTTSETAINS